MRQGAIAYRHLRDNLNLKSIFARHGIPEEVVADNMPFGSREFQQFASNLNFSVTTTSPNYLQSNGQAERAIQTVKGLLRKAEQSNKVTDDNFRSMFTCPRRHVISDVQHTVISK